jgi:positive regulator of sigma E activity
LPSIGYEIFSTKGSKMTGVQKTRNNIELHPPKALRDLILLIAAVILSLVLSYFFNVFGLIVEFLQKYPDKILYVDEVVTTLLTLSIGLAVFAWRRWLELKRETAERIRKQEELLRITTTEADTERIISKQLHIDMDQMKQDVREILHFLLSKQKK